MTLVPAGAALVLASALVWSGWAKLQGNDLWRRQLAGYYLPRSLRIVGFLILPWIEIQVAVLFAYEASWAASGVAAMMLVFSALVLRARLKQAVNTIGCGCFGGNATHDFRFLLARNAGLAALSGIVLVSPESVPSASGPSLGVMILVALAAILWMASQVVSHVRTRVQATQP